MAEFSSWVPKVLDHMLAREVGPGGVLACSGCQVVQRGANTSETSEAPKVYRCTHCMMPQVLCKSCIVETHDKNPLHIVEEWADEEHGRFWRRLSLESLGLVINLGHGGSKCEKYTTTPRSLVLVHEHGIHTIAVRFCWCLTDGGKRRHDTSQLIQHGFWPGSWKEPGSVYSIQLLHRFAQLTHQAGTSAHDFMAYLAQLTNGVEISYVKVSTYAARPECD